MEIRSTYLLNHELCHLNKWLLFLQGVGRANIISVEPEHIKLKIPALN